MLNSYFPSDEYKTFLNEIQKSEYLFETRGFSKHVPYTCPIVPCGRLVSPRHSLTHFTLDHSRIDISELFYNSPYPMSITHYDIKPNEVKCLSVLKVLTEEDVKSNETFQDGTKVSEGLAVCSVMVAKLKLGTETEVADEECFLMVWSSCLCSALQLNVRIEACHPVRSSLTSLLYKGPVKSIYTSQKPCDVYSSGDCLTITPGLLRILTDCDEGIEIIVSFYLP